MKLILVILANLFCAYCNSQNFHAFLFCKTNDKTLSKGIAANYGQMRNLFQTISDILGYNLIDHSRIGTSFKVENVQTDIKNTSINSKDIVFIYISTHGSKTIEDKDPFPEVDVPNKLISSNAIHQSMLNKNPKILITMVEACSGYRSLSAQELYLLEQSSDNSSNTINEALVKDNFLKLFSAPCDLIISSGQPGMNTWATDQGSIFTGCFIRAFNEITSQKQNSNELWDILLQRSKDYTLAFTVRTNKPHFPIWKKQYCLALSQQSILDTATSIFSGRLILKTSPKPSSLWPSNKNSYYYVDVSIESLEKIDSVIYYFHSTMPKPLVKLSSNNQTFDYRISVYGEFPIKAKVYYKNGKVEDYFADIKFPSLPPRKRRS